MSSESGEIGLWALVFFEKEYPPEVGTCLVGATRCLAWLVQDKTSELSEKTMRSTSFRTTMLRLGSTWLHQARFHWQIHGLDCVPQSYWQFYADVLHILRSNWPAWWLNLYSWNNWILWQVQLFPRLPSSHPSFLEEKPAVVRELSSFPRLGITLLFILDVCLEASAGAWVASPKSYRQKKRDASHQVAAWKNTNRDFL